MHRQHRSPPPAPPGIEREDRYAVIAHFAVLGIIHPDNDGLLRAHSAGLIPGFRLLTITTTRRN